MTQKRVTRQRREKPSTSNTTTCDMDGSQISCDRGSEPFFSFYCPRWVQGDSKTEQGSPKSSHSNKRRTRNSRTLTWPKPKALFCPPCTAVTLNDKSLKITLTHWEKEWPKREKILTFRIEHIFKRNLSYFQRVQTQPRRRVPRGSTPARTALTGSLPCHGALDLPSHRKPLLSRRPLAPAGAGAGAPAAGGGSLRGPAQTEAQGTHVQQRVPDGSLGPPSRCRGSLLQGTGQQKLPRPTGLLAGLLDQRLHRAACTLCHLQLGATPSSEVPEIIASPGVPPHPTGQGRRAGRRVGRKSSCVPSVGRVRALPSQGAQGRQVM